MTKPSARSKFTGIPGVAAALLLVAWMPVAAAQDASRAKAKPPAAHLTIADPASLSGARAEGVYQAIRARIRENYALSGDPVVMAYQNWRRYNKVPYRSPNHGERFVNNYANDQAGRYRLFEKLGSLPQGAVVIKDSFTVTRRGQVMTGPFFLMEKLAPGARPETGDWLFMMIRPDGALMGITGGQGTANVAFCAACHNKAPAGQDHLYFLPEEFRVGN